MSEELVIRQCSPTLAGLKTGNLFTAPCPSEGELRQDIRRLNRIFVPKGLRILPMRQAKGRMLLYLYRPEQLQKDLEDPDAKRLLSDLGYPCGRTEQCVAYLIRQLRMQETFPHEIGLFLSYPPEDVRGFIENHAGAFKCVGTWKVYGDANKAQETFQKYRKCTNAYCRRWRKGATIEQLTAAL